MKLEHIVVYKIAQTSSTLALSHQGQGHSYFDIVFHLAQY